MNGEKSNQNLTPNRQYLSANPENNTTIRDNGCCVTSSTENYSFLKNNVGYLTNNTLTWIPKKGTVNEMFPYIQMNIFNAKNAKLQRVDSGCDMCIKLKTAMENSFIHIDP